MHDATEKYRADGLRETIPINYTTNIWSRFRRYSGIGFLIAVGYMDPGNWATDIAAGSKFGYGLLWVVLLSCLAAMLLQTLCVRLGVVTGKDLAQLCREHFSPRTNIPLWFLAQIAVIACDFAEVLGTALALKLLFNIPLSIGILLTALDTFIILWLQSKHMLKVETIIIALVLLITISFGVEIALSQPDWKQIAQGFIPSASLFGNNDVWPLIIGIIGATVMPHNLYLHSSIVTSRKLMEGDAPKHDAITLLTWDTIATLTLALFVNAAILIVAASSFHFSGHQDVTEINDAYYLLAPLLGTTLASIIFGLALLAAGQSSTLTGTMAAQVILQGFLKLKIPHWQQRLATRLTALLPAWLIIVNYGEEMFGTLLIGSQVVLSLQLPFAMAPLIWFSGRADIMGNYRMTLGWRLLSWLIFATIISANLYLIYSLS
jgi:manganese transport protein